YAALSHCWGAKKPAAMLTKATLSQWLQSVHVKSLPRTFRDTICIARKLNIPYLWIDCLCILQDDIADWEMEAASMAEIYRNAYLTIAAASSEDSNGGCFIENHLPPLVRKFALHSTNGKQQEVVVRPSLVQCPELARSPLHTRGWILQEQILSRRTIYMTDGQIFWQCHTRQKSEDGLKDEHIFCHKTASLAQYELHKLLRSDDISPDRSWWLWIYEYSARKFTVFSDRLAALAGVTKLYEEATGDKPLLGLWERHLLQNLLWTRRPDSTHTSSSLTNEDNNSGLPSWSWIDIDG
ncbi:HET-domain-containing protein, partial [Thozetella sp. PMI_491]